jgi:hypothetical protein
VQARAEAEAGYSGNIETDSTAYRAATDAEVERVLDLVKNQNEY